MDAIEMLKQQHQEVIALFDAFQKLEKSDDMKVRNSTFEKLADMLAMHMEIEERFFYPAAQNKDTRDLVAEAWEEHREVKKLLVDAMKTMNNPGFTGQVAAIRGAFEHHRRAEENEMFAKAKQLMSNDDLQKISQQMEKLYTELATKGNARRNIKLEPAKAHA